MMMASRTSVSTDAEDVGDGVVDALGEFGVEPVANLVSDAAVGDITAEDNVWATFAERIRPDGADTVLLVGNASAGTRNIAAQGLDVDTWVLDSETLTNLGSSVTLEDARGASRPPPSPARTSGTTTPPLSTGTRRIVELAGLLALDARVLCLDEPTAGIAQRETEAFGPLLREIRRERDAAMIVIEHDMPLIMSISDRVYCLELGRVIARGSPAEVRNDRMVVASYLGTDDRPFFDPDRPVTI